MAFSPRTAQKDAAEEESDDVKRILRDHYGIEVTALKCMAGLCDRTYRVNEEFILKIFVDPYTQDVDQIQAEVDLIQHLEDHNIPVPKLVRTVDGDSFCFAEIFDRKLARRNIRPVRLQTFIKGKLLCHVDLNADICYKAGKITGMMDAVLAVSFLIQMLSIFKLSIFLLLELPQSFLPPGRNVFHCSLLRRMGC